MLAEAAALPIQPCKSLLELCLAHRIPLTHACGGMARCSTCRVVVLHGSEHCTARNAAEQDLANRLGFDTHVRLACQTHISGPAQVRRLVLDERDENFASSTGSSGKIAALGEEVVAAILFCDIRGFTAFSRRVMPYDAIHTLTRVESLSMLPPLGSVLRAQYSGRPNGCQMPLPNGCQKDGQEWGEMSKYEQPPKARLTLKSVHIALAARYLCTGF